MFKKGHKKRGEWQRERVTEKEGERVAETEVEKEWEKDNEMVSDRENGTERSKTKIRKKLMRFTAQVYIQEK